MKKISKKYPLVVEPHPEEYNGYKFITLIRYNDINYLTIINNSDKKFIDCYILDLCKTVGLNEEKIINIAQTWYENNYDNYPIGIEFSKLGITNQVSKILKIFSTDYITRIIGPLPYFSMRGAVKVRKRKRKPVPKEIKIIQKKLR